MLEFLLSLLLSIFSVQAVSAPNGLSEKIVDKLEENLPEITLSITPSANPQQNNSDQIEENVTGTSDVEETPEENNNKTPDTNKVYAYNTKSEKPIGEVAQVAVNHAGPLIPISPTLTPTPTPTETPLLTPVPTLKICPPPPCPIYSDSPKEGIPAANIHSCLEYPQGEKLNVICADF